MKVSNLREIVHNELARRGERCGCIRCREVGRQQVRDEDLRLTSYSYATDLTDEHFLQFVVEGDSAHDGAAALGSAPIVGFLRLSLPKSSDGGKSRLSG